MKYAPRTHVNPNDCRVELASGAVLTMSCCWPGKLTTDCGQLFCDWVHVAQAVAQNCSPISTPPWQRKGAPLRKEPAGQLMEQLRPSGMRPVQLPGVAGSERRKGVRAG